jgi:hypothetical protein
MMPTVSVPDVTEQKIAVARGIAYFLERAVQRRRVLQVPFYRGHVIRAPEFASLSCDLSIAVYGPRNWSLRDDRWSG